MTTPFVVSALPSRTSRHLQRLSFISHQTTPVSNLSTQSSKSALVTPRALKSISSPCTLLDASWHMPSSPLTGAEDHITSRIPGAVFFDIDAQGLCDAASPFPHMLPSPDAFSQTVAQLGVHPQHPIVIYASTNFAGAARAWWMFKVHGWSDVLVLDGGLNAWKAAGGELQSGPPDPLQPAQPKTPHFNPDLFRSMPQMLEQIETGEGYIIDARSEGRFYATMPEPRPGLLAGHMPGAINLPTSALLAEDGTMLKQEQLKHVFSNAGVDINSSRTPLSLTCGSGVTAAILSLALHEIGIDAAVYDGSWSEYGSHHQNPVMPEKEAS